MIAPSPRYDITEAVLVACDTTSSWLRAVPEWPNHPRNPSGTVSSHFGPTILSEADCVLHFVRHLHDAGVPWEDMHLELSPAQWLYAIVDTPAKRPARIDLAVVSRERLGAGKFPVAPGGFAFDAVFEFALASNYWEYGAGNRRTIIRKIERDIDKVGRYLESGIAAVGYVIIFEEVDHGFPPAWSDGADPEHGVRVRAIRRWQ